MIATQALFDNSAVLALGWTLLHFIWQGAAVGALLFLAQTMMRQSPANSRYVAACVAMLVMAACPVATFLLLNQIATRPQPRISFSATPVSIQEKIVTVAPPSQNAAAVSPKAPTIFNIDVLSARLQRSLPEIVTCWLGVVCALSLRLMLGYSRVQQIKNQAHESLGVFWTEKLLELSEQLRLSRPVRLCQSAMVEVPTVIGWLRPVILFPTVALSGLSPGQLEAILAHELAHIRRHDYLVNLLQNLIETLLFYHPAVWWVSHHISQERELCCDDLTVKLCGDRIEYARALAMLEELREPAPGLVLAARGGSLLRRIRRLADEPVESNRSGWWLAGTLAFLLAASLVFATRSALFAADDSAIPRIQNPVSTVKHASLQFRLVARESDNGPADEFEDPNNHNEGASKLRILKEVLLDGDAIESAKAQNNGLDGRPEIALTLTKTGREKFSRITGENVSRKLALLFEGRVLAAPIIDERILGRYLVIRGAFGEAEAEAIASAINFDKPTNGVSNFVKRANFMRALQGELERAISQLDGIESARVMIVTPESRLIVDPARKPAASVFLKLRGNGPLDPNTINTIRFLVANSVEGLTPKNVGIVDGEGNVLTKADPTSDRNSLQQAPNSANAPAALVEEARVLLKLGKLEEAKAKMKEVTKRIAENHQTGVKAASESKQKNAVLPSNLLSPRFDFDLKTSISNLANMTGKEVTVTNFQASVGAFLQQLGIRLKKGEEKDGGFDLIFTDSDANQAGPDPNPSLWIMGAATTEEMNLIHSVVRLLNQDRTPNASPIQTKKLDDEKENASAADNPGNTLPQNNSQAADASALVRDVRLLIELGKLEEAELKLNEALKAVPDDKTALAYRQLIIQLRHTKKKESESFGTQNLALTDKIPSIPGKERILGLLMSVHLDEIRYDDAPLSDVVKDLHERVRKVAPPGLNFVVMAPYDQVSIRIDPPLRNIRLVDALAAITKVADSKLRYSIEDYGIVFSARADAPEQLFTRTFRLNPNSIASNLSKIIGEEMVKTNLHGALHEFIRQTGAGLADEPVRNVGGGIPGSLSSNPAPQSGSKAIFYNDRTGILFVRSKLEDLDNIEKSLQVLNVAPPQVVIEVKFAEITDDAKKALGFDWFLGAVPDKKPDNTNSNSNANVGPGVFPSSNPQLNSKNIDDSHSTNAPEAAVSGILTEAQFQAVLKALKQRLGVKILSSPSVTTLSGRKASASVTQLKSVVIPKNGSLPKELSAESVPGNPTDSSAFTTNNIQVGDTLDVTPTVMQDGKSIQLQLEGKVIDFLGYDDPGPFRPRSVDGKNVGAPLTAALPLPRFRLRVVTSTATVWDGQTIVLGGFLTREVSSEENKVPVLGDVPFLGRLFRSEAKTNPNLLLFVTPTLIDPAGNRLHPPQNTTGNHNSIPPRPIEAPTVQP